MYQLHSDCGERREREEDCERMSECVVNLSMVVPIRNQYKSQAFGKPSGKCELTCESFFWVFHVL